MPVSCITSVCSIKTTAETRQVDVNSSYIRWPVLDVSELMNKFQDHMKAQSAIMQSERLQFIKEQRAYVWIFKR